jgi:plastocyanin
MPVSGRKQEDGVAFPKVLLAVPLLLAGMYAPALGSDPAPPAAGVLGMDHLFFAKDEVSVKCGQTLPMVNNSRWVHIIGPGTGGLITATPPGVPVTDRALVETNGTYETGRWTVPGRYSLTCSVHPDMTVAVVVTDCCC